MCCVCISIICIYTVNCVHIKHHVSVHKSIHFRLEKFPWELSFIGWAWAWQESSDKWTLTPPTCSIPNGCAGFCVDIHFSVLYIYGGTLMGYSLTPAACSVTVALYEINVSIWTHLNTFYNNGGTSDSRNRSWKSPLDIPDGIRRWPIANLLDI